MRFILGLIGVILIIGIVIFMYRDNQKSHYNYTIKYNYAKYTEEDYTNEFEYISNGTSIRYVNEFGDSIYRSGTFFIEKNQK